MIFPYDPHHDPAAPVLPALLEGSGGRTALVHFLVDTGADASTVPPSLAHELRLPSVGRAFVAGVVGERRAVTLFAARWTLGKRSAIARFLAVGDEPLLGRDLLGSLVATLDGPGGQLRIAPGTGRARR